MRLWEMTRTRLADHPRAPNIGIVTRLQRYAVGASALSSAYPDLIKAVDTARKNGATAQVAGGVPAMCDGVTQGQVGHGAVAVFT